MKTVLATPVLENFWRTKFKMFPYSFSLCLQLLGPEDMVNPHVDELSMMTYLSQYPDAKLKPGAPIKARGDPSKVRTTIISIM